MSIRKAATSMFRKGLWREIHLKVFINDWLFIIVITIPITILFSIHAARVGNKQKIYKWIV